MKSRSRTQRRPGTRATSLETSLARVTRARVSANSRRRMSVWVGCNCHRCLPLPSCARLGRARRPSPHKLSPHKLFSWEIFAKWGHEEGAIVTEHAVMAPGAFEQQKRAYTIPPILPFRTVDSETAAVRAVVEPNLEHDSPRIMSGTGSECSR
jgi:hypothetical protein